MGPNGTSLCVILIIIAVELAVLCYKVSSGGDICDKLWDVNYRLKQIEEKIEKTGNKTTEAVDKLRWKFER